MHWYSHVWYPHICTQTWMMICLLPWRLKWSCSGTYMQSNELMIVLEAEVIGGLEVCLLALVITCPHACMPPCSYVWMLWWLYAHMPVCSHLHAQLLTCPSALMIVYALMLTCLDTYNWLLKCLDAHLFKFLHAYVLWYHILQCSHALMITYSHCKTPNQYQGFRCTTCLINNQYLL